MKRTTGRFLFWLLAGYLLVSAFAEQAALAQAVGQLLNARGSVSIERRGKIVITPALTGEIVREGDTITVGKGASVQVLLSAEGRRYALPEGSRIQVKRSGFKTRKGGAPKPMAKIGKRLSRSTLTGPGAGTLVRGGETGSGPYHPTPVGAISTETVSLRWEGVTAGDLTLRLQEYDTDKPVGKPITLAEGTHEYLLPAKLLKPGVWYVWSVSTRDGHYCSAAIRRTVRSDAALIAVLEQEAADARRSAPKDPTPDLLLAKRYADLGLFDKARNSCAAALKLRPHDAGLKALWGRLNPTDTKE